MTHVFGCQIVVLLGCQVFCVCDLGGSGLNSFIALSVQFISFRATGAEDNDGDTPRKRKRKIIKDSKLQEETKAALEAEEARRKRVKDKQKLYNDVGTEDDPNSPVKCPKVTSLVLDRNEKKEPLVQVVPR